MPAAAPFVPLIGAGLGAISSRNQPKQVTTSQGGTSQSFSQTNVDPRLTGAATQLMGQNPGYQVAPLSTYTQQAGSGASQIAGGSLQGGANRFADAGGENQYLQTAFDRAANLTQPRLAAEFATSGRFGKPASQGALRADELGAISSNLLMPLLESERNRQFSATEANLGREQAGFNRQLASLPVLAGVGQMYDQNAQQRANAGGISLDQQIARLGALSPFFGTSQTQSTSQTGNVSQPTFNNPMAGAVGGLLLGQQLAGAFPGVQGSVLSPINPTAQRIPNPVAMQWL